MVNSTNNNSINLNGYHVQVVVLFPSQNKIYKYQEKELKKYGFKKQTGFGKELGKGVFLRWYGNNEAVTADSDNIKAAYDFLAMKSHVRGFVITDKQFSMADSSRLESLAEIATAKQAEMFNTIVNY